MAFRTEEDIEEWYKEARKTLDDELSRKLAKDIHDGKAKADYGKRILSLKERYERLHGRRQERLDRRVRFLTGGAARTYFKVEWLWRRLKRKLRRAGKDEAETGIPDHFLVYLEQRIKGG